MNGADIKKGTTKPKQMASAVNLNNTANGNSGKKRRKGTDLKPIVTNDGVATAESSSMPGSVPVQLGSVSFTSLFPFPSVHVTFAPEV